MPDARSVAIQCLEAWTRGDFETARDFIHPDVVFSGPLGTAEGADAYLSGLQRLQQMGIHDTQIKRVFVEDDDVCSIYDLSTPGGTIHCATWYQVQNGQIMTVHAFFDSGVLV